MTRDDVEKRGVDKKREETEEMGSEHNGHELMRIGKASI
jgi:hypothetical protein